MAGQVAKSACETKQEAQQVAASLPTVTATITVLHEDKPLVVQVAKGTTIESALKQAGVEINPSWEAHINGKLAALNTPIMADAEIFYSVRLAGGK